MCQPLEHKWTIFKAHKDAVLVRFSNQNDPSKGNFAGEEGVLFGWYIWDGMTRENRAYVRDMLESGSKAYLVRVCYCEQLASELGDGVLYPSNAAVFDSQDVAEYCEISVL